MRCRCNSTAAAAAAVAAADVARINRETFSNLQQSSAARSAVSARHAAV